MTESGGVGPNVLERLISKSNITNVQRPHFPTLFLALVTLA